MENIYGKNGLQKVINASGRMTKLGVSTISKGVGETLVDAASNYILIDSLYEFAGKKIGEMIGCEDACVTSSASAGIALSVASLICRDNLSMVHHFFDELPRISRREVVLLKGHNVDFGVPVAEMIQLGGGKVVEVGYANGSKPEDIEHAVNENTLAVLFVKSHHCVQKDMVDVEETVKLSNRLKVPCIIDAAAEEDLSRYMAMGADMVCYSGAKAIEGPTSGFVACRTTELAANMRLQYKGIGRAMKIGKEGTMGLLQAMKEYLGGEHRPVVTKEHLVPFIEKIDQIPGCDAVLVQDEAGREIYRAKITFHKETYGYSAKEMISRLQEGEFAVYTRDYQANIGSLAIDPRPLHSPEELEYICERISEIGKEHQ